MRRDQVREAVSIEVAHGQWNRIIPWPKVLSSSKRAVSAAEQNREIMRAPVSYRKIRKPIAVEIGDHHRLRAHSGGNALSGAKSAVAVSKQDGYRTGSEEHRTQIRHGQVPQAVTIEIAHRDSFRQPADREGLRRVEGPIPVTEQNGDRTRLLRVNHRQI